MKQIYDPEEVLPAYRAMVVKLVRALCSDKNKEQDLIQEGYIAMWKALKTFDGSRGHLPSYLKMKAKGRILECLSRSIWTGTPPRYSSGISPDEPAVDTSLSTVQDLLEVTDSIDFVAMKYHEGEILQAMQALGPIQRDYVVRRFWYGQTNAMMTADDSVTYQPEGAWKKAKLVLGEELEHLASLVRT